MPGRPFQKGHDPRRNTTGRPKLTPEQRGTLREMSRWAPEVVVELRRRLLDCDERTSDWVALFDRWIAYTVGTPDAVQMLRDAEQVEQLPEDPEERRRMLERARATVEVELSKLPAARKLPKP